MFAKQCDNPEPHQSHVHAYKWPENDGLVYYRCRGVERVYPLKLDLENGKYTLMLSEDHKVTALRYGEAWREFVGDKFMYVLARQVFGLGENE
jgi:hypothetical protein